MLKIIDTSKIHYEDVECVDGKTYMVVHAPQLDEVLDNAKPLDDLLDKISEEINSPNRGTCDYFVIEQIEKIVKEYRKGNFEDDGDE